jgi:GTP diphosphokinase / guanosine-3',5'-bis(diphosphate) 3'-diphosphatase
MQRIKLALDLAFDKHQSQKYGKAPYITHLVGVASRMETESEIIVALLHDVLEDTDCTIIELISKCQLLDTEILAINLLNKNEHESYDKMLVAIKENSLATKVKIQDISYNLESSKKENNNYRIVKYTAALNFLYK